MIACSTGSPASRRPLEIDALDHAAVFHVQAGDDTDFQHEASAASSALRHGGDVHQGAAETASAGTPVVRLSASASSSMSSASPSRSPFQRCAWALKRLLREKCTGGRSRFIASVEDFATGGAFAGLKQALEMAHGAAQDLRG